jgi:hypothetical protein
MVEIAKVEVNSLAIKVGIPMLISLHGKSLKTYKNVNEIAYTIYRGK